MIRIIHMVVDTDDVFSIWQNSTFKIKFFTAPNYITLDIVKDWRDDGVDYCTANRELFRWQFKVAVKQIENVVLTEEEQDNIIDDFFNTWDNSDIQLPPCLRLPEKL